MGRLFKTYLNDGHVWSCLSCSAHLVYQHEIISKNFQGRDGRAYLVTNVVNIGIGDIEDRTLRTGVHTVADIHCNVCATVVGWKYLSAQDKEQKYKENKFLVEREKIQKDKPWI